MKGMMKTAVMTAIGKMELTERPIPSPAPGEVLVKVEYVGICGSDLHPYHSMPDTPQGVSMGHECVGVVEDIGNEVTSVKKGDVVITPFAWSDGTCEFCRERLPTSCSTA